MMYETKKWRCPYCDGLNDWEEETCQICGDGRREDAEKAERDERIARTPEFPKTYTPQERPEESASGAFEPPRFEPGPTETRGFKPEPLPPRPELPRTAYESVRREEPAPSKGHAVWFWLLTVAFVALCRFDGIVVWWTTARRLGLVGTPVCPLRDMSGYGLFCAAFLGLMPLAAVWLRSKGVKALAVIFALAGCACAGGALYAMAVVRGLYSVGWLMYSIATIMALVYASNGRSARTFANFCLVFGIVSLIMSILLTTYLDNAINVSAGYGHTYDLHYVGMMWWQSPKWYDNLFNTLRYFDRVRCPASAWVPFSRALVLLAMSAGFRMPQKES